MSAASLALCFGRADAALSTADAAGLAVANAVIDGAVREPWAHPDGAGERVGDLVLWRCGSELWGAASAVVDADGLGPTTHSLYRQLFHAAGSLNLHRIWNYIPSINAPHGEGDRYQTFCRGRALAIGEHPDGDGARMPAASALGTPGDTLALLFVAGPDPVQHVENPRQIPAHCYPRRYGAHAPTFARGSLVTRADGTRRLYLSGTASIRASESLHPGDVAAQFEVALENADLVARSAGLPGGLSATSPGTRRLRLYLRHPLHWDIVRALLDRRLRRAGDTVSVIQADVCRPELLVEIEACVDVAPAPG
ncbi:MAG: hypothetical protein RIC56_08955 [Pseudomonadales bacterium]